VPARAVLGPVPNRRPSGVSLLGWAWRLFLLVLLEVRASLSSVFCQAGIKLKWLGVWGGVG
jgi:hypothetical protein